MTEPCIKLRISTPAELFLAGRGFYQLEEDSLYVQVGQTDSESRFFSFIEAPNFRLDLDRTGRLLFIEVNAGRHTWKVTDDFQLPSSIGYADIRWLDFRRQVPPPTLTCNQTRTTLCLSFSNKKVVGSYYLADSIIVQTAGDSCLAAIIITNIIDDLAGQEIAGFRKEIRGQSGPASL